MRRSPPFAGLCGLALFAALSMATPSGAQSTEATKVATALVEILSPADRVRARVEQQVESMRNGDTIRQTLNRNPRFRAELARNSPAIEAGIRRIGKLQADTLGPVLMDMQDNSRQAHIAQLVARFSVAELRQITAFYKTTAGAKFLQQQGEISAAVARSNMENHGQRLQDAEKSITTEISNELRQMFPNLTPGN